MTPKPAWIKIYQLIPVCLNWSKSKYGVMGFDASLVQRHQPTCELRPGNTGFYCPHLVINPRSLKGHGVYAKAWNWITNKWWFLYFFFGGSWGRCLVEHWVFTTKRRILTSKKCGIGWRLWPLEGDAKLECAVKATFTAMVSWWNTLW